MRILHVADLHFDMEHFAWLENQASKYDLVVIAGDLLEFYDSETPLENQKQLILASLRRTAGKCKWLAICSGNHDVESRDRDWLSALNRFPNCILDDQNKLIESSPRVVVTCCFWHDAFDRRGEYRLGKLLDEGASLRSNYNAKWIVVHHSPLGFGAEGEQLLALLQAEKPNLVLSGHVHDGPFAGGPLQKFDSIVCLNPGSAPPALRRNQPPHIVIDLGCCNGIWKWGIQRTYFHW